MRLTAMKKGEPGENHRQMVSEPRRVRSLESTDEGRGADEPRTLLPGLGTGAFSVRHPNTRLSPSPPVTSRGVRHGPDGRGFGWRGASAGRRTNLGGAFQLGAGRDEPFVF